MNEYDPAKPIRLQAENRSEKSDRVLTPHHSVPTTCLETAYGTTVRLSFQIKVF
jgi:hypothetical protein